MNVGMTLTGDLTKRLEQLPSALSLKVQQTALAAGAELIRAEAALLAPRDDGPGPHMADNIIVDVLSSSEVERGLDFKGHEAVVEVGPTLKHFYGCVFGSRTGVTTDKGTKFISSIKVGDKVLTQAGDFRHVTAIQRYPAVEKPHLVTLRVEYRHGREHRLTLTTDHKVLVFRDSKFQWVEAGLLAPGDVAVRRRKRSWSEGTAVSEQRTCEECGHVYTRQCRGGRPLPEGRSQGRRFCSAKCAATHSARRHTGMKRSVESRAKMAAAARERLGQHPESHPNRIMAARGYETEPERVVAEWLAHRSIDHVRQHRIGGHFVDFYLPETGTVIEADGAYWHRDQAVDIERDKELLTADPSLRILHMHFVDKRFSPLPLNREPLPAVTYVPCNPGPASFADPDTFEDGRITSVDRWTYKPRRGLREALLYDLSVDGVPSFVASGIVVHNSFSEYGTSRQPARPWFRPAFDTKQGAALNIVLAKLWEGIKRHLGSTPSSTVGSRNL